MGVTKLTAKMRGKSGRQVTKMVDEMRVSIKERRLNLGLSQHAVAKKAGVSRCTIFNIESGLYLPTLHTLLAVQKALHLI